MSEKPSPNLSETEPTLAKIISRLQVESDQIEETYPGERTLWFNKLLVELYLTKGDSQNAVEALEQAILLAHELYRDEERDQLRKQLEDLTTL